MLCSIKKYIKTLSLTKPVTKCNHWGNRGDVYTKE